MEILVAPIQAAIWGAAVLAGVNVLTYLAFAYDKSAARAGHRRISEATLLNFALLGGSPAAKLAQRRLRHKTRKQPFARRLNVIVGLHLAMLAVLPVLIWLPEVPRMLLAVLGDLAGSASR